MNKTIIAALFTVLVTANAVADTHVNQGRSRYAVKGSIQEDKSSQGAQASECGSAPCGQYFISYLQEKAMQFAPYAFAALATKAVVGFVQFMGPGQPMHRL
jgi:hypothetical protein